MTTHPTPFTVSDINSKHTGPVHRADRDDRHVLEQGVMAGQVLVAPQAHPLWVPPARTSVEDGHPRHVAGRQVHPRLVRVATRAVH